MHNRGENSEAVAFATLCELPAQQLVVRLRELLVRRSAALAELAALPPFRTGNLRIGFRKCGNPTCSCSSPDHPGHGPRAQWTKAAAGGRTRSRTVPLELTDLVTQQLDIRQSFYRLRREYFDINDDICDIQLVIAWRGPELLKGLSRPDRELLVAYGKSSPIWTHLTAEEQTPA